jgi:hypothetical protein
LDLSLQSTVIALCPNNISPAVQACVDGTAIANPLTTLGACLSGLVTLGTSATSLCGALPATVGAFCQATGSNPCTEAAIANIDPSLQGNIISLCPNNISPSVANCFQGTLTNPLTSLSSCLTGIVSLNGNALNLCGALAPNLAALCLTNGVNPCTEAGIATVDLSVQAQVITLCPNNISPNVAACVAGTTGATVFTSLGMLSPQ